MAWLDKFKKKPLLTNDELLAKLDTIEAHADELLLMVIAGTSKHEIVSHYKEMVRAIRRLVMLDVSKGRPVPAKLNATIRDMGFQGEVALHLNAKAMTRT